LPVEGAGLIAGNIKLHIFLIDPFIAIHPILLRIVIHGVVPPVEQGIGLSLIDRIAVTAPGIFLHETPGDIIDCAVPTQRIEHQKEPGFMIVMFFDSGTEIRLDGKNFLRPPSSPREEE
jgi:hypothetical protein